MVVRRRDWVNRTPRWRASLTKDRVERLIEMVEYFLTQKGLWNDPRYVSDLELLRGLSIKLDEPLPARTITRMVLFEE